MHQNYCFWPYFGKCAEIIFTRSIGKYMYSKKLVFYITIGIITLVLAFSKHTDLCLKVLGILFFLSSKLATFLMCWEEMLKRNIVWLVMRYVFYYLHNFFLNQHLKQKGSYNISGKKAYKYIIHGKGMSYCVIWCLS